MLAVKQAFLRRVDDLQVVSPQRSAGRQRRYTRYEIRVIQQVVSMADEGITLQAIRRIIELERQLAAVTRERDELARRLAERVAGEPVELTLEVPGERVKPGVVHPCLTSENGICGGFGRKPGSHPPVAINLQLELHIP